VADGVDIQRKLARKMLTALGFNPEAVSSGEEAVEHLKTHAADLLLLDMIMRPGKNGREAYEAVLAFKPGQKAVIASGMAEGEEVDKGRALGASRFLLRPYSVSDFANAVWQALNGGSPPPEAAPSGEKAQEGESQP
jgi:CheY-like chemotaxis protein